MLSTLSMGDVNTAIKYAKEITLNNDNHLADLLIFIDHIKNERFVLASNLLKKNKENYLIENCNIKGCVKYLNPLNRK